MINNKFILTALNNKERVYNDSLFLQNDIYVAYAGIFNVN